eukprot:gene791-983_t
MSSVKAAHLEKSFISNVGDLFKYLDTLTVPAIKLARSQGSSNNLKQDHHQSIPKSKSNSNLQKNATTSIHFFFQDQMMPGVNALLHLRTIRQMSVAEIFRERMVRSKDLLTEQRTQHYIQLMQSFIKTTEVTFVDRRKTLTELCNEVVLHLQTYTMDPDSCVVGLIPSEDLLYRLARDTEFLYYKSDGDSLGSSGGGSGSGTNNSKDKDSDSDSYYHSYLATTINSSRQAMLTSIFNWSALDDISQIAKSVRRFSSIMRGIEKLKKGDIIIVKFNQYTQKSQKKTFIGFKFSNNSNNSTSNLNNTNENNLNNSTGTSNHTSLISTTPKTIDEYLEKKFFKPKAQFARFTGEKDDYTMKVWFSSEENEMVTVGIEDILPLSRSIIEALKDIKLIEKMIYQPSERFFSQTLEDSKQQTLSHLDSIGVNVNFVHEASQNACILDLDVLKPMHQTLHSLYNQLDHQFYKDLDKYITEKIDNYLLQLDHRLLFMPRYEHTIQDLRGNHHISLSRSKIKQYLGDSEMALDRLKIEKRNLMNGTKKEEITEWWLKRIENRVNEFLGERGYNFTAVPENYIEQPPANMKDVISNLMLIQKILDPVEQVIEIFTTSSESEKRSETPQQQQQQSDEDDVASSSSSSSCIKSCPQDIPTSKQSNHSTSSPKSSYSSSGGESYSPKDSSIQIMATTPTSSLASQASTASVQQQQQSSSTSSLPTTTQPTTTSTTTTTATTTTTIEDTRPILTLSNKLINSPMQLIKELKEEIYPIINDFIKKAQIVLCEQFDLPLVEFSLSKASECLQSSRSNLDPQVVIWIEDMLCDLEYLNEMQRLEDVKNEKVMHIVPIGGLVMNTFARLENELNTVVELWGDSDSENELEEEPTVPLKVLKTPPSPFNDGKTQLHICVANENFEQVEQILENEENIINEVDVNGWTPLHSAAYSGNADICKLLLKVNGIDVTKKNKDGASVLHYFVRHPLTEKRKEVILTILKKGLDINTGSRHGETPLHSASFRGHNDVVLFLLENGSNPNAVTAGGETSLHYAVTSANYNVVSTLLLGGAQWNIRSKRGTPLELAKNAKLSHIISLLENGPDVDNFSWRRNNKALLQQHFQQLQQQQQEQQQEQQLLLQQQQQQQQQQQIRDQMRRTCKIEIGGSRGTLRKNNLSPSSSSSTTPTSTSPSLVSPRVPISTPTTTTTTTTTTSSTSTPVTNIFNNSPKSSPPKSSPPKSSSTNNTFKFKTENTIVDTS